MILTENNIQRRIVELNSISIKANQKTKYLICLTYREETKFYSEYIRGVYDNVFASVFMPIVLADRDRITEPTNFSKTS